VSELEAIVTKIPGPRSLELARSLAQYEPRGVTYLADDFPVFWESGSGATVTDVDHNRYIDFTSAFGVALTGHTNPAVAAAIGEQAARLPHAMGDVHPGAPRVRLLERLAALAPLDAPRAFLCSTGSEAIEFALKSALLATGEANVLAFAGAYHGLSYGALEVSGMAKFRKPWQRQLRETTTFVRYPDGRERATSERALESIERTLKRDRTIGAVLIEPIQGRAGVIIPPEGFLRGLRRVCTERDTVLILDEIYTGFGRTGTYFACSRQDVRPDILCVGKALGGGFPVSAAILSGEVSEAWEPSQGEALHTSTYLGNPMGCAAALANLDEIERLGLPERARELEGTIAERLHAIERYNPLVIDIRGRGMLWAMEFKEPAAAKACVASALQNGLMLLQSGLRGECVTIAPPLVIAREQLLRGLDLLTDALRSRTLA